MLPPASTLGHSLRRIVGFCVIATRAVVMRASKSAATCVHTHTPSPRTSPKWRARREPPGRHVGSRGNSHLPAHSSNEYDTALLTAELDSLIEETRNAGKNATTHVVAFSGGVDSSLCAYLVFKAFGDFDCVRSGLNNVYAAIGVSPALPTSLLEQAREVAKQIGIPLREVQTTEGQVPEYVKNEGDSCFYCKNTLYETLSALASDAEGQNGARLNAHSGQSQEATTGAHQTPPIIQMYNGTNLEDTSDTTRLGLVSAANHGVVSPLISTPKSRVRELAKLVSLPNWDLAAAPCLRSRLAIGVEATVDTLRSVEMAEEKVRHLLKIKPNENMRVRVMKENVSAFYDSHSASINDSFKAKQPAVIELDPFHLSVMESDGVIRETLRVELGKCGLAVVETRGFRSGSVAKQT